MTTLNRLLLLSIVVVSLASVAQELAQPRTRKAAATVHSATSWTVKAQWVRADEDFLASDALQGRGSGTRDEEIAAQFVASKFESFGLKPAAPESSFVETVDLIKPKLDAHAQLSTGGTQFQEGPDFYLLTSSGDSFTGKLQKLSAAEVGKTALVPEAVVLLSDVPENPRAVFQILQKLGDAALVVVQDSPGMKQIQGMMGGQTRTPMRVKGIGTTGDVSHITWGTLAVASADVFSKLSQLANGTDVSLTVHQVPTPPAHTYNAMAELEGSDPKAGAVLISAHLDHLGVRPQKNGEDDIYNGADDDASGTTAVIELARALAAAPKPRRTVYFVCFGSEETGGQGDNYFRAHPPVPLEQFVANIEFEMIGAQDPKLPKGYVLLTGWERTNLGPVLREHGAKVAPDPYPEQHYFQRSDNYALALKGVVAQTAGGWGNPPWYHRPNDDLSHLDWNFMTEVIQSFVAPIHWLIDSDFKPEWKPGGMPK